MSKFTYYHGRYTSDLTPSLNQIYRSIDRFSLKSFEGGLCLDTDSSSFEALVRDVYALQYSIHDLLHAAGDLVYKHMSNMGYDELRQLVPRDLYEDCERDRAEFGRNNQFCDFALDDKWYHQNNVEGFFLDPKCVKVFQSKRPYHFFPETSAEDARVQLVKDTELYTPLYYKNVVPEVCEVVCANDTIQPRAETKKVLEEFDTAVIPLDAYGLFVANEGDDHVVAQKPVIFPELVVDPNRVGNKALAAVACATVPVGGYKNALMLGSGHGSMSKTLRDTGIAVYDVDLRGDHCFRIDLLRPGRAPLFHFDEDGCSRCYPDHTIPECESSSCTGCLSPTANKAIGCDLVFSDLSHDKDLLQHHVWAMKNDRLYAAAAAIALINLRARGNFVLKVTQLVSPILMELVDMVACYFERVDLVKPYASRWLNGEYFIVFSSFSPETHDRESLTSKLLLRYAWNLTVLVPTVKPLTIGPSLVQLGLLIQRKRFTFAACFLYRIVHPQRVLVACHVQFFDKPVDPNEVFDCSHCYPRFTRETTWLKYVRSHDKPGTRAWRQELVTRVQTLINPGRHHVLRPLKALPYSL